MSVYKPKSSPFWHYDFVIQGRRVFGSSGQRSKTEARRVEAAKRRELAQGPKLKDYTLDEACGTYWTHVAEAQPSARTTRSQIRNLLAGLGKGSLLTEIDQRALSAFALKRRAGVSDSTVNREMQCLRRIVRWMRKAQGAAVATVDWRALMLREPKERVRELSDAEQARLLLHLRPDLHPIVLFGIATGVRLAGARTLTWERVDFMARKVTVRGKGGKWLDVPLTPSTLALIANQPRDCDEVFTYECRKNGRKLRKGRRYPITQDGWRKEWKAALIAAGIEDFRFHDLRHTFASRFLRSGGDPLVLQKALGHEDLESTRRYAHVRQDDVRAAMERMESRNSPGEISREASK